MTSLLRGLGIDAVAHGFRSSFRDWAAECTDAPREVCELGRAAPFRCNDQLLKLLPTGLVAFPGGGISGNLVEKARGLGIPVFEVDA